MEEGDQTRGRRLPEKQQKRPADLACWPLDFARTGSSRYFCFERVTVNVSGVAEVAEGDLNKAEQTHTKIEREKKRC